MNEIKLSFVDDLPKNIEKIMRNDLVAYEFSHVADVNYKKFALILTDPGEP